MAAFIIEGSRGFGNQEVRHWGESGIGSRGFGFWESGSQGGGNQEVRAWGISPHRKSAFEQMRAGGN